MSETLLEHIGLSFSQLVVFILILIFGVIAIRITVSFDVNKYLKDKKETNLNKLRNACTHHRTIREDDSYVLQALFVSPPGTLQWQCQRCGAAKYFANDEIEQMTKYFLENFEEYARQEKKFQKLLKKNKLT